MDQPDREHAQRTTFERLIEEYADRIYNIALRITGHPQEAEDVMQEAFLNAFRSWASFRGEATPATWLYRIAVNAALERARQRHPLDFLSEVVEEDIQDWSSSVVELVQRAELQERVLAGIQLLPPDLRVVLVLRDIDGLSTAEAAAALEISEAALKSRLHRARSLLRQHLADYFRGR